jgi:cytochrome c oxidase subunit IV
MVELPKIMSKKVWFLVFNLGTIIYLTVSGSLRWEVVSIFSYGLALLLMNGIAWISACKYKGWK